MRFCVIILACASNVLGAQRPPANTDNLFTRIVGVRELRDGGVLVGDAGAKTLLRLSPDLRTARQVGEYASVTALFASPEGGATLFDFDGARLIRIDDVGRLGQSDSVPAAIVGNRAQPLEILHMDADARAYFIGARANPGANTGRDSVPLIRKRLDRANADTITWLRIPSAIIEAPAQAGRPPVIRVPTRFAWRDVWAVGPTGRVAVVRGDDYHVEWFDGAQRVASGPTMNAPRLPLTAEDRLAVAGDSFSVSSTAPGNQPRIVPDTISLPPVKPFFVESAPRVDERGELWVERSRGIGDRNATYDVFDAAGKPRFTVTLADDARVVGFSDTSLYASIRSADGKSRLARHDRPGR